MKLTFIHLLSMIIYISLPYFTCGVIFVGWVYPAKSNRVNSILVWTGPKVTSQRHTDGVILTSSGLKGGITVIPTPLLGCFLKRNWCCHFGLLNPPSPLLGGNGTKLGHKHPIPPHLYLLDPPLFTTMYKLNWMTTVHWYINTWIQMSVQWVGNNINYRVQIFLRAYSDSGFLAVDTHATRSSKNVSILLNISKNIQL